jgi:hypothetical protein
MPVNVAVKYVRLMFTGKKHGKRLANAGTRRRGCY